MWPLPNTQASEGGLKEVAIAAALFSNRICIIHRFNHHYGDEAVVVIVDQQQHRSAQHQSMRERETEVSVTPSRRTARQPMPNNNHVFGRIYRLYEYIEHHVLFYIHANALA